jgi:hypothetical protein
MAGERKRIITNYPEVFASMNSDLQFVQIGGIRVLFAVPGRNA